MKTLIALLVAAAAWLAPCQTWTEDTLASALVGDWVGTGTMNGQEVALERSWSLALSDHFLRGEMRLTMSNGLDFSAMTFWKMTNTGGYRILWLDEIGQMREYEALPGAGPGVTMIARETNEVGRDEWRRWDFELTETGYREAMYRMVGNDWELLASFVFERSGEVAED